MSICLIHCSHLNLHHRLESLASETVKKNVGVRGMRVEINRRPPVVALERRLSKCRNVVTLGVKPNFSDYSFGARESILKSDTIYYPSLFYADLFNAMGKNTFPSYHTYKCVQDKIKQTALFDMLAIPHPKTRVYYGPRQTRYILDHFSCPFVAKVARGSALGRGVFLIKNKKELADYLKKNHPAYIQTYLPIKRDLRMVVIGKKVVHSYWREAPSGEFRTNLALGGRVNFGNIPEAAKKLAVKTAQLCGWDDVGLDICHYDDKYYVLEANMKYGREGFRQAGIDYHRLMEKLIANHDI